jgi:TolB-like protein
VNGIPRIRFAANPPRSRVAQAGLIIALAWLSCLGADNPSPAPVATNSGQAKRALRLAVITEVPSAAAAADLLTAELSKQDTLHLLERSEIERIYREQVLAAANKDYLKLGQVLGADGLLLLSSLNEGTNQFVQARLVAVKPGAILASVRFLWPVADAAGWAAWLAGHFSPQFAKLTVVAKDAIPLSVLNLRSALRSAETERLERQLTLLVIERLSRQPQLFVLERQRMELLTAEKELRGLDDSAFWNGSYLLEGSIDREGYSPGKVTVDATLAVHGGRQVLAVRISGSRTNLADVVNRLAEAVTAALKVGAASRPWSAPDEAAHYFQEAQWALKWKAAAQAQAGAEAAWALGKQDLDCALARVRAHLAGLSPAAEYVHGTGYIPSQIPERPGEMLSDLEFGRPIRAVAVTHYLKQTRVGQYVVVNKPLNLEAVDRAVEALTLYADFSQTLGPGEPKLGSPWYDLGVQALDETSRVLRDLHFVPEVQAGVADKLAELRRLARWTSAWMSASPSVRASYWYEDQAGIHDVLYHSLGEDNSLFKCQTRYGCFWQEQPEDCLALYCKLMSSAAFSYLHGDFVSRELQSPRLAAWSNEDRQRAPEVWRRFMLELNRSTNPICQIEARFLELADLTKEADLNPAIDALARSMTAQRDFLITNNVEVAYFHVEGFGVAHALVSGCGGVVSDGIESAHRRLDSDYRKPLEAVREEFLRERVERGRIAKETAFFERQRQYLQKLTPYQLREFAETFPTFQYAKSNAAELLPLVVAYKSNLVAQVVGPTGLSAAQARNAIWRVGILEQDLRKVLDPAALPPVGALPANLPVTSTQFASNASPLFGRAATRVPPFTLPGPRNQRAPAQTAEPLPDPAAAVLEARCFNPIPPTSLVGQKVGDIRLFAHRLHEDALVLDLCYSEYLPVPYGRDRAVTETRVHYAVAVWQARAACWEVLAYPEGPFPLSASPLMAIDDADKLLCERFDGALYFSGWDAMQKSDFQGKQWHKLVFPGQKRLRLFVVSGGLFAANEESIFEIANGGATTHILASCRRRPAASTLDALDTLGKVTLFPGPNRSLRALVADKIHVWNGHDWQESATLDPGTRAEVFEDAVLLRSSAPRQPKRCWLLPFEQSLPELCLEQEEPTPHFGELRPSYPAGRKAQTPAPGTTWRCSPGLANILAPAATSGSNLCFFMEHAELTNAASKWAVAPKDGRHATLVCFARTAAEPVLLPLRFLPETGLLPNALLATKLPGPFWQMNVWMGFTSEWLFIGQVNLPAVWAIPRNEFEAAIRRELKRRQDAAERKEGH